MTDDTVDPSALAKAIETRLAEHYGRPQWREHAPPLDELIATILSQHTSDVNSGRAFAELRTRFPTWNEAATADAAQIVQAIESGGLANLKAPRILRVLRAVEAQTGART